MATIFLWVFIVNDEYRKLNLKYYVQNGHRDGHILKVHMLYFQCSHLKLSYPIIYKIILFELSHGME